jgi:hypothetical protein
MEVTGFLNVSVGSNTVQFHDSLGSADCECGDGLQTEEHIFWDCKLYEDQRATVTDI